MKAQTRSLKYCPYCGSKVKAIFDTVEAGEPYPVGVQAGKYECPDCGYTRRFNCENKMCILGV